MDIISELQGQVSAQTDVIEGLIKSSQSNNNAIKLLAKIVNVNEKALNNIEEDLYVNDLFQLNKDTK